MNRSHQDATSPTELFDLLWESLADVPGTAATATLLRRAIKRVALGIRVFLVALTAHGPEEDRRRSSEAGSNGHLVKPVSYEDLTRLLGRVEPSDA